MMMLRTAALTGCIALAGCAHDAYSSLTGTGALAVARSYEGTNPTGQRSLWCADFMNHVERRVGRSGTGSRMARSYLNYGTPVPLARARPGDIVVLSRGRNPRAGHVGYFERFDSAGNPILMSGNACSPRTVCSMGYPRARVLGVRRPS